MFRCRFLPVFFFFFLAGCCSVAGREQKIYYNQIFLSLLFCFDFLIFVLLAEIYFYYIFQFLSLGLCGWLVLFLRGCGCGLCNANGMLLLLLLQ